LFGLPKLVENPSETSQDGLRKRTNERAKKPSLGAIFGELRLRNCLENRDRRRIGVPKAAKRGRRAPNRPLPEAEEARSRGLWLFSEQFLQALR
jgi:hypothetical protein